MALIEAQDRSGERATDVVVLCYHALSPDWGAPLSVTPALFERQVAFLSQHGYRPATFTEALTAPPARRTVAITFDDAYRSVLSLARPVLDRHGFKATVFVPTAFPDRQSPMAWPGIDRWIGGRHEAELRCMSWAELAELSDAGWEIGSHTVSHPRLTTLDDASLDAELSHSRARLEQELGVPCSALAYPYGDVDERVRERARAAGYRFAAALPKRLTAGDPLSWPRVGIYHADAAWRWRLKLSPRMRRARSGNGWSLLARLTA